MSWLVFACQGFAVSSVCLPRVCVGTKETIISLKSIKKGNKQQQCKPNSNIRSKEAEYYKICRMFYVNQSLDRCKQEWAEILCGWDIMPQTTSKGLVHTSTTMILLASFMSYVFDAFQINAPNE